MSTIEAVTGWLARTRHNANEDYLTAFGFAGRPFVDRELYPFEGKPHISEIGCHGATALYVSLLRIVNIPVDAVYVALWNSSPGGSGGHRRPYFPSVDRSMPHGDNVRNRHFSDWISGLAPVQEMLFDATQMDTLILNPTLDCDQSGCNTVGQQASHNAWRSFRQSCADTLCDVLVSDYIDEGAQHVRDISLAGPTAGGIPLEFAAPLFSEAEKDAIVADIESYLLLLGDGDLEEGKVQWQLRGAHAQ